VHLTITVRSDVERLFDHSVQNSCNFIYLRNTVCFRYIIVNIVHKDDNMDDNNNKLNLRVNTFFKANKVKSSSMGQCLLFGYTGNTVYN